MRQGDGGDVVVAQRERPGRDEHHRNRRRRDGRARGGAGRGRRRAAGAREARRIGGVGALVELGAVEEAVEVAVDADADARAGRHAGVHLLLPVCRGQVPERRLRDHRVGVAIGLEVVVADVDRTARLAVDDALDDEVAIAGVVARDQQVDAARDRGVVHGRGRERHLLADDRPEPRVHGQHERLDVPPLRVVLEIEDLRMQEDEDRGDGAVVEEAEAAHLGTDRTRAGDARGTVRKAEHADLLVEVPEMRDLELLHLAFER